MLKKTEKDLWVEMSIREISTQGRFAEISYSHIYPKSAEKNDLLFSSIHSFLSHCAMVSKMLCATDDGQPPKNIGSVLMVASTSFIHKRHFRNNLEHYDNRLKEWIKKFGVNVNIGAYNIGPKSAFKVSNLVFVNHFDPDTCVYTFVNEDFDLKKLYVEVLRIKQLADDWVMQVESGIKSPPFI